MESLKDIKYFDMLNRTLEMCLEDKNVLIFLHQYGNIEKLAQIMLYCSEKIDDSDLSLVESIDIKDSLSIAAEFFKSINLDYYNKFIKSIEEDYPKRFFKREKGQNCNSWVKSGAVHIEYNETIQDIFSIVHEYAHKFSCLYSNINENNIKNFLGEVSAQTTELMLGSFLKEKQIFPSNEISKHFRNDFLKKTEYKTAAFMFYRKLIEVYIRQKDDDEKLSYNLLEEELKKMDPTSVEYHYFCNKYSEYLDFLLDEPLDQLSYYPRYVVGSVLGMDLYQQIKEEPSRISNLFLLIEILGHDNSHFDEDMRMIADNLNIISLNDNKIVIDENIVNRLRANYEKGIKDFKGMQIK